METPAKARAVACRLLGVHGDHYWPKDERTCRYCGMDWDTWHYAHTYEEGVQELRRILALDELGWPNWALEDTTV